MRSIHDAFDEVGTTLSSQGMPPDEVRAVLGANDAVTVRRHLELHRERLSEQLADRRRAVDDVERLLVVVVGRPRAGQDATPAGSAIPSRKPIRQVG